MTALGCEATWARTQTVAALALCLLGAAPGTGEEVSVARIEARSFYGQTGSFSGDLLSNPHAQFVNVPLGGSLGGPSDATLLLVQLAGPPGRYLPGRQVQASARWSRTLTQPGGRAHAETAALDVTQEVGAFGPDGRAFVGFWLAGTGCSPVVISVRLRAGSSTGPSMRATLPFSCAE